MGGVNAAKWRHDLLQFDDLFERRERARDVKQPSAQAECAIAHALPDKLAHAFKLGRAWSAIGQSTDRFPHCILTDESRDSNGAGRCFQSIQERSDRCRQTAYNGARAISTLKNGCDTLADIVVCGWYRKDVAR